MSGEHLLLERSCSNLRVNKSYKFLHENTKRNIIVYGGSGSGKSVAIAQLIYKDLWNPKEKINWLALRKYGTTVLNSIYFELEQIINDNNATFFFKINKSSRTFTNLITKNWCLMKGLDDPEKVKSIGGVTKVWLEEATEFTVEDLKQLFLRLRGKGVKKQFYFSFNPVDATHYIKERFFDNVREDTFIAHTTYKDNLTFLDEDYIQELMNLEQEDYYYYTVYTLGEWGVISKAKVFHNLKIWDYGIEQAMNLPNPRWGMDFGFVHASTLMGTTEKEGELWLFPELYHRGLTNPKWVDKVQGFPYFDKSKHIVADCAEPDRILEFKDAGFKMSGSKKGKGSVDMGIRYLTRFKTINIHKTLCPNASREFQSFKRREMKDGTILEEYLEKNDDTISGIRYSREDLMKQFGPKRVGSARMPKSTQSKVRELPTQ